MEIGVCQIANKCGASVAARNRRNDSSQMTTHGKSRSGFRTAVAVRVLRGLGGHKERGFFRYSGSANKYATKLPRSFGDNL
jgi:hypothetical protein